MIEADRRLFLAGLGGLVLTGLSGRGLASQTVAGFHMWHSPGCGCCLEWGRRVEAFFGRKLVVTEAPDMARIKRAHGVPDALQSCHTALIHSVVAEGHVPPADIRRLIQSGHKAGRGLAVPGMPAGSPGMDVGHSHKQPYKVYVFGNGRPPGIFASYGA
ncbi:MAG TPA: DUF411 domain-containing protein [Allosphingosinicella sp.]|nr:DUF411 domain-containing protein [Allosphingosinicella sp.]